MRVKMSKQPPPAPTASAVGPCPTVIQIVGRPGTGSLPSTIAPPDHPRENQTLLTKVRWFSSQDLWFCPSLFTNGFEISEIVLKGP